MAYASRSGRAITNHTHPRAFGVCQRCNRWFNRHTLTNQRDWRGSTILPLYLFVCNDCLDIPQEQLRAIVLPADPMPIQFALTEPFQRDETNYRSTLPVTIDPVTGIQTAAVTTINTESGDAMSINPIGSPAGLEADAIMPLFDGVAYGVELPVLSVISSGTGPITVTCSSAHGLATDAQIAVSGLTNVNANGFYSITVTTATAFTFQPVPVIASGSLLAGETRIVTANVGIPLGFSQIPQV